METSVSQEKKNHAKNIQGQKIAKLFFWMAFSTLDTIFFFFLNDVM